MNNEKQIKELQEKLTEATRTKDAKGVESCFAEKTVMMLLPPPLRFKTGDNAPGPNGIQEWFDTFECETLGYDVEELEIAADEKVAFCHSLIHLVGTKTDGQQADVWFRETLGLAKTAGEWKITHQHQFVPYYMDSFKAALDLKP